MDMPPLQLSSNASSKSGDLSSMFGDDHSGWAVNFGNGVSQGAGAAGASGVKPWMIGAAVLGAVILYKKLG